jgi:kynurenine formamidase
MDPILGEGANNVSYCKTISSASMFIALFAGCQPTATDGGADTIQRNSADAAENPPSRPREQPLLAGRYIDLTHSFDQDTIYWPTADGFRFTKQTAGETPAGYFYAANSFATAEHGGTHIDAPIHFAEDHPTVDQIPLDRLIGEAVLIDVSKQCAADPDYQIGVADLRGWEERHERQLSDVIVLLRTGYGAHWPDRKKYLGTLARGEAAVEELHFPGLAPDAAQWLAEQRLPKLVGIDTASIDPGQSRRFQSHVTLFKHNIPALENLAHLDQLPETGFQIIALPMKIAGGSGGPTRVVAVLPEE